MFPRVLPLAALALAAAACTGSSEAPDAGDTTPDAGTPAPDAGGQNTGKFCGNGRFDPGEACERVVATELPDGGIVPAPAQGCSDTCQVSGTCTDPIDLNAMLVPKVENGLELLEAEVLVGRSLKDAQDDLSTTVGSCGGSGPELVFRYTPSVPAVLYVGVATPWKHKLYARTSCNDATAERGIATFSCAGGAADGIFSDRIVVPAPAGEEVFLVIDAEGSALESNATIQLKESPYVTSGADCTGFVDCAEGTACTATSATAASCSANDSPLVQTLRAVKGDASSTDKLTWLVEANDPQGNWFTATLELLDAQGKALRVFDADNDRALETVLDVPLPDTFDEQPQIAWKNQIAWPAAATALAPTQLRITLWDGGFLKAAKTAPIEAFTAAGPNQTCDPTGFASACVPGTICGANAKCQAVATLREAECTASTPPGDTSVIVSASGPSLWEPPTACAGTNAQGTPEAVIRLTIAQKSKVTITTGKAGTNFDTVVMLLQNCGIDGTSAPFLVGCNDDQAGQVPTGSSLLVVDNVLEGDYAIVVDSKKNAAGQAGGAAEVLVTVEPAAN